MKTKFKIGDKVFIIRCNNGEVTIEKLEIDSIAIDNSDIIYFFKDSLGHMTERQLIISKLDDVIDILRGYYGNDK